MGPPAGPADSWAVYKGKLYMNFHPQIRDRFFQNPDANIRDGNARWIQMWGDLQAGPFNTDCLAETWSEKDCRSSPASIPGITPGPSPGPGPSPAPAGNCTAVVHKLCGGKASVQDCVECCKGPHKKEVRPVCASMKDVIAACQMGIVVV